MIYMDTAQKTEQAIDSPALTGAGITATHTDFGPWETVFLFRNNVGVTYYGPELPHTVVAAHVERDTVTVVQDAEKITISGRTQKGETFTAILNLVK